MLTTNHRRIGNYIPTWFNCVNLLTACNHTLIVLEACSINKCSCFLTLIIISCNLVGKFIIVSFRVWILSSAIFINFLSLIWIIIHFISIFNFFWLVWKSIINWIFILIGIRIPKLFRPIYTYFFKIETLCIGFRWFCLNSQFILSFF